MSASPEQIQALADAVSLWRMQEYIYITFYASYVYYVISTMPTEVSTIFPQKWGHGKVLYLVIRYGMLVFIAVVLARDYRNHYIITPIGCKALLLIYSITRRIIAVATDACLGLCLSALLQTKRIYALLIIALCVAPPLANFAIKVVSDVQYPADPVTPLDEELGYPCYYLSTDQWEDGTTVQAGSRICGYISFAMSILLAILGVTALIVRYKGQRGRLFQVIWRDGGLQYITLIALRLAGAILYTPAIIAISTLEGNAGYTVFGVTSDILVPILAQRLLINMRRVDYMGSKPFASTLLFAPPASDLEDDFEDELGSDEASAPSSGVGQRELVRGAHETHDAEKREDRASLGGFISSPTPKTLNAITRIA